MMMDGTDADGEWSDEEAVRSGSNTGVSETEQDDPPTVSIKRPKPPVTVTSMSTFRFMTSSDPLVLDDPVNSILDKIDAEIEAMDQTPTIEMTSSKPTRPGSSGRSKSNHSRHTYGSSQVPSLVLNKSVEQEDTDTGLGSASFRGDDCSNPDKINGTAEVYSEAALTDGLTDEDTITKNVEDVPSDLDSLVAQQIDIKFKEIMRKKKDDDDDDDDDDDSDEETDNQAASSKVKSNVARVKDSTSKVTFSLPAKKKSQDRRETLPPDLPMHPGKPTASGSISNRLRQRTTARQSATMLSTGYGTDNDSVKTEDFEAKFMNMLVTTSDNERAPAEMTLEKRPIKNREISREAKNRVTEPPPIVTETPPTPAKSEPSGNPTGEDDDIIQRLRNIADGSQASKTPTVTFARPRSLSPTRLRLQRYRPNDNLRGLWDSSPFSSARNSSQVFSWDDEFWKRKRTQSITSSNSTFEEVESLCLSKSSGDSHFGGSRPWERWARTTASGAGSDNAAGSVAGVGSLGYGTSTGAWAAESGRGGLRGSSRKFLSRQSSTTSTSTSLSSGPVGTLQSSDSSVSSKESVNLRNLLKNMELLSRQGGLDATEKLYLEKILQRVVDWNNSKSSGENRSGSPLQRHPRDRFSTTRASSARVPDPAATQRTGLDLKDFETVMSSYRNQGNDARRHTSDNRVEGETTRRRDLILPEEEDSKSSSRALKHNNTLNSLTDSDIRSMAASSFTAESSLKQSSRSSPKSSSHGDCISKDGDVDDIVRRPSVAMFMSRNSLNKGGSFDSTASPTDPFGALSSSYASGQAERILMGLGFASSQSFLPERFMRDWYNKVSMAHELELREQEDSAQDKSGKEPSASNSHVPETAAPMRRDSRLSLASSSLDEAANLLPSNNAPESKIQRLREYVANFSSYYGSNEDGMAKIRRFASSRQKSLPLYLETLSEEEENRSRIPGVDPFDKENKLKMFICEEMSHSGKSTSSTSDLTFMSSSQSENDSMSSHSDNLHHSRHKKTNKLMTEQRKQNEKENSRRGYANNELREQTPKTEIKEQASPKIERRRKSPRNSPKRKLQIDNTTAGVPVPETHVKASSRSAMQYSNDSLEVADIMKNQTPLSHGAANSERVSNVPNKAKPIIKAVEPAMVSIVLEDVDEGLGNSAGNKSGLKTDSAHLSIPISAQALSPIPQSPVTVIEVGLDNQHDSLDTEEWTGSSREADEDVGTSYQCKSCGRLYSDQISNESNSAHRQRHKPQHQDTVRRVGSPICGKSNLSSADKDEVNSQIAEKTSQRVSLDVPLDTNIDLSLRRTINNDDARRNEKRALSPQPKHSETTAGCKSPTSFKRKSLKRQRAHQGRGLPCDETPNEGLNSALHTNTNEPSSLQTQDIDSSERHSIAINHCRSQGHSNIQPLLVNQCTHGCHQHKVNLCHCDKRCFVDFGDTNMEAGTKVAFANNKSNSRVPDSAFRTTRRAVGMRSVRGDSDSSQASETDPGEFSQYVKRSLDPRNPGFMSENFQTQQQDRVVTGSKSSDFDSNSASCQSSPLIFSSNAVQSPRKNTPAQGRVQTISRAVQANLSHMNNVRTNIYNSLLNSDDFYLACDRQVQCCLRDTPSIGTTHFHKSVQTANQRYEISSQTCNEPIPLSQANSLLGSGSNDVHDKSSSASKGVNTVLCLIGHEHNNFPWEPTSNAYGDNHVNKYPDTRTEGRFQLVDETLNQIEQEISAIDHKHTESDNQRNFQKDLKSEVKGRRDLIANSEEKKDMDNPMNEIENPKRQGLLCDSKNDIRNASSKNDKLTDRTAKGFPQDQIQKMDIMKEMKAYLSPCFNMLEKEVEGSHESNDYSDPIKEDTRDDKQSNNAMSCPPGLKSSSSTNNANEAEDMILGKRHNKLSRLKYTSNSHDNSCNSLDIETDFMNAGDPLGTNDVSANGNSMHLQITCENESHSEETPTPTKCNQQFQLCPHLPRFSYGTEPSSSDNLMTDSEDTQTSSRSLSFEAKASNDHSQTQVCNHAHDKLRRLWPPLSHSSKHPILRGNKPQTSCPDSVGEKQLSGLKTHLICTNSNSSLPSWSSADGSGNDTPDIVISPLVSFQMDFLTVPTSPHSLLSHVSYPDCWSKSTDSSNYQSLPEKLRDPYDNMSLSKTMNQSVDAKNDCETPIHRDEVDTTHETSACDQVDEGIIPLKNDDDDDDDDNNNIFSGTNSSRLVMEPEMTVQSSVDSFTQVSEFDSITRSFDDVNGSDVIPTTSDVSGDIPGTSKSQSDISAILTDDNAPPSANDADVNVWCLWNNAHPKSKTPKVPVSSLRRHNTWEGSRFAYIISVTDQASVDSASDRSVAGSDLAEDIDDAEVLMYQSTSFVRRDSDSTYSEPELDLIDNLSQFSLSSAGNQLRANERIAYNVSPNCHFGVSPFKESYTTDNQPTPRNEFWIGREDNQIAALKDTVGYIQHCTHQHNNDEGRNETRDAELKDITPDKYRMKINSNARFHNVSPLLTNSDWQNKFDSEHTCSDREHGISTRVHLVELEEDHSSEDECDKEISRINVQRGWKGSNCNPPTSLMSKHQGAASSFRSVQARKMVAIPCFQHDSQTESNAEEIPNVRTGTHTDTRTESEKLLQTFKSAQLSTLIDHETCSPDISESCEEIGGDLNQTSLSSISNHSSAVILSVEYDVEQPRFTSHPNEYIAQKDYSQDYPTTLMDELEVMALFKSMQEIDSSSLDTSSPRGFKLSQITEEETQSEDSLNCDHRNRHFIPRYQSQLTNETLVEAPAIQNSKPNTESNDIPTNTCHDNFDSTGENSQVKIGKEIHSLVNSENNQNEGNYTLLTDKAMGQPRHDTRTALSNIYWISASPAYKCSHTNMPSVDSNTKTQNTDISTQYISKRASPTIQDTLTIKNEASQGSHLNSQSRSTTQVTQRTVLNFNVSPGKKQAENKTSTTEEPVAHLSTFSFQVGDYRRSADKSLSIASNDSESQQTVRNLALSGGSATESCSSWNTSVSSSSSLDGNMRTISETESSSMLKESENERSTLHKTSTPVSDEKKRRVTVRTMYSQGSEDGPHNFPSRSHDSTKTQSRGRSYQREPKTLVTTTRRRSASSRQAMRSKESLQLLHHQEQIQSSCGSDSDSDLTSAMRVDCDVDLRERDLAMGRLSSDYMDDEESVKHSEEKPQVNSDSKAGPLTQNTEKVICHPAKTNDISNAPVASEPNTSVELTISGSAGARNTQINGNPRVVIHQPSDDFLAHESMVRLPVAVDKHKTLKSNDNHLHTQPDDTTQDASASHFPPVSHWSIPRTKDKSGQFWTQRLQRANFLTPQSTMAFQRSTETPLSYNRRYNEKDDSHPELDYLDILSKLTGSEEKQKRSLLSLPDQREGKCMMSPPLIKIEENTVNSNFSTSNQDIIKTVNQSQTIHSDSSQVLSRSAAIVSATEPLHVAVNCEDIQSARSNTYAPDSYDELLMLDSIIEDVEDDGGNAERQSSPRTSALKLEPFYKPYTKSPSVTSKDSGFESSGSPIEHSSGKSSIPTINPVVLNLPTNDNEEAV